MYKEEYAKALQRIEEVKEQALKSVVSLFETIQLEPINIGNYYYYICEDKDGKVVPACVHQQKYRYALENGSEPKFTSIYNPHGFEEGYGYSDFTDVARILDMIRDAVLDELCARETQKYRNS